MKAIRKWFHDWQLAMAVRRLNRNAAFFGFGPLSPEEWLRCCSHVGHASERAGVSVEHAAKAFAAMGRAR